MWADRWKRANLCVCVLALGIVCLSLVFFFSFFSVTIFSFSLSHSLVFWCSSVCERSMTRAIYRLIRLPWLHVRNALRNFLLPHLPTKNSDLSLCISNDSNWNGYFYKFVIKNNRWRKIELLFINFDTVKIILSLRKLLLAPKAKADPFFQICLHEIQNGFLRSAFFFCCLERRNCRSSRNSSEWLSSSNDQKIIDMESKFFLYV